jgi:putative ABC transport system permease protein
LQRAEETVLHALADLRLSLRSLFKRPIFSIAVVLALALGIGATTALFSVVSGVLLEPLPYREPEGLVVLWPELGAFGLTEFLLSEPELLDFREQGRQLAEVAGFLTNEEALTGIEEPRRVKAALVTEGFFEILGVPAHRGRLFTREDFEGRSGPVVLLGHDLWRAQLGGDSELVGQKILLGGTPSTVVGILPPDFRMPLDYGSAATQVVRPRALSPASLNPREVRYLHAVARLAESDRMEDARAEVASIVDRIRKAHPDQYPDAIGWNARIVPLTEQVLGHLRKPLLLLLVAGFLVLLTAAVNVANLLAVRLLERRRELATRAVLGAGRRSLLRLALLDHGLLVLAGAALGIGLADAGLRLLVAMVPTNVPRIDEVGLDLPVLGFALLVTLAVAAGAAVLPALRASKVVPAADLREDEGGRRGLWRPSSFVVAVEVAAATVLLVSAVVLLDSFRRLQEVDLGFDPEAAISMRLSLPEESYAEPGLVSSFDQEVFDRLSAVPGLAAAGFIDQLPIAGAHQSLSFEVEGLPVPEGTPGPQGVLHVISPGALRALGTPILSGRHFTPADRAGSRPVVIVNETLARRFWPEAGALGQRLRIGSNPTAYTVVGIARDVRLRGATSPTEPEIYRTRDQVLEIDGVDPRTTSLALVARFSADPLPALPALKDAVWSLDRNLPIDDVQTLEAMVSRSEGSNRLATFLAVSFAGIALVLAVVGVYGVVASSVRRRVREIGIRMAVGASRKAVFWAFLREGMKPALVGIALGLAAAASLARLTESLVFGASPASPSVLGIASLILAAFAAVSISIPSVRAVRVQPAAVLREE